MQCPARHKPDHRPLYQVKSLLCWNFIAASTIYIYIYTYIYTYIYIHIYIYMFHLFHSFSMFHSHHFPGFLLGFEAWAWLSSTEPRRKTHPFSIDCSEGLPRNKPEVLSFHFVSWPGLTWTKLTKFDTLVIPMENHHAINKWWFSIAMTANFDRNRVIIVFQDISSINQFQRRTISKAFLLRRTPFKRAASQQFGTNQI